MGSNNYSMTARHHIEVVKFPKIRCTNYSWMLGPRISKIQSWADLPSLYIEKIASSLIYLVLVLHIS